MEENFLGEIPKFQAHWVSSPHLEWGNEGKRTFWRVIKNKLLTLNDELQHSLYLKHFC